MEIVLNKIRDLKAWSRSLGGGSLVSSILDWIPVPIAERIVYNNDKAMGTSRYYARAYDPASTKFLTRQYNLISHVERGLCTRGRADAFAHIRDQRRDVPREICGTNRESEENPLPICSVPAAETLWNARASRCARPIDPSRRQPAIP